MVIMLDNFIKNDIESRLSVLFDKKIEIIKFISNTGGCINNAFQITTNNGDFFLKYNNSAKENFFKREAQNLSILKNTSSINVPKIILKCNNYLLLEFISSDKIHTNKFWLNFGYQLSKLHSVTNSNFGLSYNNFIGNLVQNNELSDNWIEFFITKRLLPQIKICEQKNFFYSSFDKLFNMLDNILVIEKPSLLHGDLWSGNFISRLDKPYLIDPAIYFGNREMDIAMTKLFGGFNSKFYNSYNDSLPLQNGWQERLEIYNLYPLLVHLNIFGQRYLDPINSVLKRYL